MTRHRRFLVSASRLRLGGLVEAAGALLLGFLTACGSSSEPTKKPPPGFTLTRLSTDTFTNSTSQHATEVEADTFSFGSTIVSVFQVGRRAKGGGGADIGFATSKDGGATWTSGFLSGITMFQGAGAADAASDPSVAYDAAHGVWLIATLSIFDPVVSGAMVSRSADGVSWDNPVTVSTGPASDKTWVVCDNGTGSPFFGHCYVQWEDINVGTLFVNTSTDGGLTWGPDTHTLNSALGVGGQSVVLPTGRVVMPLISWDGTTVLALTSNDGGDNWNDPVTVAPLISHLEAGGLRSGGMTADIDSAGKVFFVWSDCRFRNNCSSNDLVMSTSTDGISWTSPVRIPIDPVTSTVDHFLPGLGIDPATDGTTAHLTLIYYFYPQTTCTFTDCALDVGFVSSQDGGNTWSAAQTLAGPMSLSWLPNTGLGYMVGDYLSVSYANGKPFSVFAVAKTNSGIVFDEAMYTTTPLVPLPGAAYFSSKGDKPVPHAKSDHKPRKFQDEEYQSPTPPGSRLQSSSAKNRRKKSQLSTIVTLRTQ